MSLPRRAFVLLLDICFIVFSYTLAILLHNDFVLSALSARDTLNALPLLITVKILVFVTSNLYRSIWKYASLHDLIEIFKTVSIASICSSLVLVFFEQGFHLSRVVVVLDWGILLALVSCSRVLWRLYQERYHRGAGFPVMGKDDDPQNELKRRTLIVGAGDAGNMLLREIFKQPDTPYRIIGFLDDDRNKQGMRMHGVPVLGTTDQLQEMVETHCIDKVIIATPSAGAKFIRGLVETCQSSGVRFKIIPCLNEIINGEVSVSHLRDVEIEDLLGRDPVRLDESAISSYLRGMRVLVSGAAGSIGSEICRQVGNFKPSMLILLESAETPLYAVEKELAASYPDIPIVPIIVDVRNRSRVESLFATFEPEVVFHAAAYKHVPMMEYNPCEAITNNCGGTRVLADVADASGVKNFVMISTDKAVNPTNVMGASKRVAELYVQSLAVTSATRFTTVRFGNVLGSNGSVIPLFKEQIRNGGPITVTDERVIRYFMTIPEATQLVLQAGCLGMGGDIFVLDMGEPVRILDLAIQLIRLSGLVPYEDIDISITGLRPGEKLYEELLISGEGVMPTAHEKIRVLCSIAIDREAVMTSYGKLMNAAAINDISVLMTTLKQMLPEFRHNNTYGDSPPVPFRHLRPDLYSGAVNRTLPTRI
jgi:FlaA1/EpsC-like NDP-sugar epimerase